MTTHNMKDIPVTKEEEEITIQRMSANFLLNIGIDINKQSLDAFINCIKSLEDNLSYQNKDKVN